MRRDVYSRHPFVIGTSHLPGSIPKYKMKLGVDASSQVVVKLDTESG